MIQDPLDPRDWLYTWSRNDIAPAKRLLSDRRIEDQRNTQSCTAQATASCCAILSGQEWSALFNYFLSRELLGGMYLDKDNGSTLRGALRAASKLGMAPDVAWPFDERQVHTRPTADVIALAAPHKVTGYFRIYETPDDRILAMRHALASGKPVTVGMIIGTEFIALQGDAICKAAGQETYLHAMCVVGYDQDSFYLENSWGQTWGNNGIGRVSIDMMKRSCVDAWVVGEFDGNKGTSAMTFDPVRAQIIRDYLKNIFGNIKKDADTYKASCAEIDSAMGWAAGTAEKVLCLQ